ncbi:DUF3021 family protein [Bacillus atrophaeus]|uniref:DUF3021 family protein n=1 Tax=Bacillus atrophaeus TaxID=1452 RepID=UPI0021611874|nr:DUF3021 family protein [Bacillus atrophaeus]
MKLFNKFYLFSYESKGTMGMYFASFVVVYLIFGRISVGPDINLDLWTAVQMVAACGLIGFSQRAIVTKDLLSMKRCFLWGLFSSVVTVSFTIGFGWFDGFPLWCGIVFCTVMIIGYMMMWLALYWESERETRKLNKKLREFQEKGRRE